MNGKPVTSWTRNVKSGTWILRYALPRRLAPGNYKLTVAAVNGGERKASTIRLRVKNGRDPARWQGARARRRQRNQLDEARRAEGEGHRHVRPARSTTPPSGHGTSPWSSSTSTSREPRSCTTCTPSSRRCGSSPSRSTRRRSRRPAASAPPPSSSAEPRDAADRQQRRPLAAIGRLTKLLGARLQSGSLIM